MHQVFQPEETETPSILQTEWPVELRLTVVQEKMLWKKRHDKQQMRDASSEGCHAARTVQYPSCCLVSNMVWVAPPSRKNDKGVGRVAHKTAEQEGVGGRGDFPSSFLLTNVVFYNTVKFRK